MSMAGKKCMNTAGANIAPWWMHVWVKFCSCTKNQYQTSCRQFISVCWSAKHVIV